ncbi:MAG: hypothetical protein M1820_010773 [Bogoriella megaspora]|nr:MAG: hypothetical protein M1820_010773 [Bogoriella megaspora]
MAASTSLPSFSAFLNLPLELQHEILSYVLPQPPPDPHTDANVIRNLHQSTAWTGSKNSTAILRVCKSLSELGLQQLYRHSTFFFDICQPQFKPYLQDEGNESLPDETTFLSPVCSRPRPGAVTLLRHCNIGFDNFKRIRNCYVIIDNAFIPMGKGICWEFLEQLTTKLVSRLNTARQLEKITVEVDLCWIKKPYYYFYVEQQEDQVLETLRPLRRLNGVQKAKVTGLGHRELEESLEQDMMQKN